MKDHTMELSSSAFYSHQKLGLLTSVEGARIVSIADCALTVSLPKHQLKVSLCPETQRLKPSTFFFKKKCFLVQGKYLIATCMSNSFLSTSKLLVSVTPCSNHEISTIAEIWFVVQVFLAVR